MATNAASFVRTEPRIANRWVQMCHCRFAMVAIANLQYVRALFINPLTVCLNAGTATTEVAFAVPYRNPPGTSRGLHPASP
jgi:hypothetical protein